MPKPLPGTYNGYLRFGLLILIVVISPLVIGGFWLNLEFGLVNNLTTKLAKAIVICNCFGGFWILYVKMYEYFHEIFLEGQRSKFMSLPENDFVTFHLTSKHTNEFVMENNEKFFLALSNAFLTNNLNKKTRFMQGKAEANFFVDFVIRSGNIDTFVSVQAKKVEITLEIFKRFFPNYRLMVAQDPISKLQPEHSPNNDNFQVDGFCLGNSRSSLFPYQSNNEEPKQFAKYLESIRSTLPNSIVIVQAIFRFNTSNIPSSKNPEYINEFQNWRESVFAKYAPINPSKPDSTALKTLLPQWVKDTIDNTGHRLNFLYPTFNYKVLALSPTNSNSVYPILQNLTRTFENSNQSEHSNFLEIKYNTSTSQEYHNTKSIANSKFQYISDSYILADWFGGYFESFASGFYNKIYYSRENHYRKQNLYRTTITRQFNAPWASDLSPCTCHDFAKIFQFPF
jgi:hypothetical protein